MDQAQSFVKGLYEDDWKILNSTPSIFELELSNYIQDIQNKEFMNTSHAIIGQEFDKVGTFIGKNLKYDKKVK
ncbi:hypothetical protein DS830_02850 [Bombilactobacillus bombi]|nr:hypothetical protein DS830_02850 [Bombilactobacillus bombi]